MYIELDQIIFALIICRLECILRDSEDAFTTFNLIVYLKKLLSYLNIQVPVITVSPTRNYCWNSEQVALLDYMILNVSKRQGMFGS